MTRTPPAAVRFLEWDSEFFGVRIASMAPAKLDDQSLLGVVDWARTEKIACLYALSDADDIATLRRLESAGARLVDIRMTFERRLDGPTPAHGADAIRTARESDIAALRKLAAASHTASRFFADGGFERARCEELYATWIEKSCRGWADRVLVAELDGRLAGYVSCHVREGSRGEIGLVAVAPEAQGRGLGAQLVDSAVEWLAERELSRVTVVTQGSNAGAQRLYQSRGFRTSIVQLWHHLWFDSENVRS